MRSPILAFGAVFSLVACAAAHAPAEEMRQLTPRPGVTLRIVLVRAKAPQAAAILFAGGHGNLSIREDGTLTWGNGNFLVRSRHRFAANGITVAVIDAPSDRQGPDGMSYGFRAGADHATDIRAVMDLLRVEFKLPVWLVGTSRGTKSAANGGVRLQKDPPAGIVLTASVTEETEKGSGVLAFDLEKIRLPVLVVHHRDDECWVTPYEGAMLIKKGLIAAVVAELMAFSGGETEGNPCRAQSHHGFLGIEDQVVKAIADWIKAH